MPGEYGILLVWGSGHLSLRGGFWVYVSVTRDGMGVDGLGHSFRVLTTGVPRHAVYRRLRVKHNMLGHCGALTSSRNLSCNIVNHVDSKRVRSFLRLSGPATTPSSRHRILSKLLPRCISSLSRGHCLAVRTLRRSCGGRRPSKCKCARFGGSVHRCRCSRGLDFRGACVPKRRVRVSFTNSTL